MNNFYKRSGLSTAMMLLITSICLAQTNISGNVTDASGETLAGVNIQVKGRVIGTISDTRGNFELTVNDAPPMTLVFSFMGYTTQEVSITDANTADLKVQLEEQTILGQEIVVSASRVEESILRSPVTVEKVDLLAIQQAAAPEYFDALANVKGVQVTTSSLNFPQINTRGFATIANERFVQWIDGIDGSAPILNFPTGNIVGIGELDAESMELIPGAASALYGPNAFNGILIMSSKSPFEFQGLSAQAKAGITTSDAQGESYPFYNFGIRYAKAFNNKFAFKVNFSVFDATDWKSNDYKTDRSRPESQTDLSGIPDFDGVNLYGDEPLISVPGFAPIRRTGFKEEDVIDDYTARSLKGDVALHYRVTDKIEALYNYRYGSGNAIFQGDAKYALRDFTQQFHKVELRADNFFVRGYLTATDAGDSYNFLALGLLMNERYSPSETKWVPEYIQALLGLVPGVNPGDHQAARSFADRDRPQPGTQAFDDLVEDVRNTYFQRTPPGSKFIDNSRIWHGEFNYNFKNQIEFAEIMIGGNMRQYDLFTDGTILNEAPDASDPATADFQRIAINEFGVYTQVSKTFANALKVTGSLRYDKNENFDGQITPRVSAVYTFSESHNLRGSFQTGFRNPQTQAQFIFFPGADAILLGSTEANAERYGIHNGGAYTRDSYLQYQRSGDASDLIETNVPYIQPEQLKALELGYKGLFSNNFLLDINGYYNIYNDFIGNDLVASKNATEHHGEALPAGTIFYLYSNSPEKINSYGIGVGITYNLPRNFALNGNYNYADYKVDEVPGRTFFSLFNTPNNKFNVGIGNRKLTTNLGFNLNFRWQEGFLWQSAFGEWNVPEFGVFDAMINYKVSSLKSHIKLGGTNLLGGDYRTNLGGPFVGKQYYISITFDEFFNK